MHGSRLLRSGALLGAFASLAAVGLAIPTTAAAKVTSLTSCQTISSPGKYRLDADVNDLGAPVCFPITASNVTLILNGHTISSAANGPIRGINVTASGVQVTGPGTVTGFGAPTSLPESAGIGLFGGSGSVRGVTVTGNGVDGIRVGSAGNSVRGNVTTGNGVGIQALAGATGNTIIGNYAHGNTGDDLFDNNNACDSNVWRGNDFGTANQSCIN